jgi:hypothetical protein
MSHLGVTPSEHSSGASAAWDRSPRPAANTPARVEQRRKRRTIIAAAAAARELAGFWWAIATAD